MGLHKEYIFKFIIKIMHYFTMSVTPLALELFFFFKGIMYLGVLTLPGKETKGTFLSPWFSLQQTHLDFSLSSFNFGRHPLGLLPLS